jgi:hypothetical protein
MTTELRTTGYIYDPQTGRNAAWLDSNGDVHDGATGEKIYTQPATASCTNWTAPSPAPIWGTLTGLAVTMASRRSLDLQS